MRPWLRPLTTLFLLIVSNGVHADPATLPFSDCFSPSNGNVSSKFNIDTIYAQVLPSDEWGMYLNLTLIGSSPEEITGFTNESSSLATLFTSSSVLTLSAWSNSSYLCEHLRPPSPLSPLEPNKTFCPIPAGSFALASTIPWGNNRALTTLNSRIRAVDPFSRELLCVDVSTTPLDPQPDNPYGDAIIIFWSTVGLTIAYWLIVGIARIVSAWGRGLTRSEKGIWSRAQSAGFILASAISGERLATSPALMRFCTPSMRDIIFHTQWCAALAMVSVQWPNFIYPLLSQTAWSTLIYNITLTPGSRDTLWNPLSTLPYNPPQGFADQLSNPSSPLYIVPDAPNLLFTLPEGTSPGIEAFAYTIGVRPQDLFGVCLILFLGIIAGTLAISFVVWFVDHLACLIVGMFGGSTSGYPGHNPLARVTGTRSPVILEAATPGLEENKSITSHGREQYAHLFRPASRGTIPFSAGHGSHAGAGTIITSDRGLHSQSQRAWWRIRSDMSSFHGSVLLGNVVRILVLFHLPVTIFSCFHMTLPRAAGGTKSGAALATLSFVIFGILIPAYLVYRVRSTTTNKLFDETRTLLAYGPLYNHYRHGSQMFASLLFATNLAFGVTIGAGQGSGTAQAVIILVVEVISALVTSIWLPWGSGASMGLISFLFCVARIVVAVLLVILTPAISIGAGAGGWVAYGILVILALVYLALVLMLAVKILEAIIRILGGVGFDRSKRIVDSGLLGACGLLGCCGSRDRKKGRGDRSRSHRYRQTEDAASQLTQPASPHALPMHRNSDGSSYLHHAGTQTPPRFFGQEGSSSRKGSTHSGPPPSVLRPEHALRPYREDNDDDGYIMGAWQPFSRTGHTTMTDGPLTTAPGTMPQIQPAAPKTGFSRIGGGKAHMDTPYAIATGSTHTFPSVNQQSQQSQSHLSQLPPAAPVFHDDEEDSPPPSLSNVGRHYDPIGLPPGAMQPAHIRTKSQSAVIEDASSLISPGFTATITHPSIQGTGGVITEPRHRQTSGGISPSSPAPPQIPLLDNGDSDDESQPKRKHWYQFGRKRVQSGEGLAGLGTGGGLAVPPTSEGASSSGPHTEGESEASAQPARSFVVIRKNQPSATPSDSRTGTSTS